MEIGLFVYLLNKYKLIFWIIIVWRWFTPNNGNSGITSFFLSIFDWYFYFFIPILTSLPVWNNSTYNIFYDFTWVIHWHQVFNQYFLLFNFADNTFITVKILWILIFVFAINILVINGFQNICIIFFLSTWSIYMIITIIFCLIY